MPPTKVPLTPPEAEEFLERLVRQYRRQRRIVHLCANENRLSNYALFCREIGLAERYLLGSPPTRGHTPAQLGSSFYYHPLEAHNFGEAAAERTACKLFDACDVDLRPISGIHAMITTVISLTQPNDIVYTIGYNDGGHHITDLLLKRLGRRMVPLPLRDNDLDADAVKVLAEEHPPAMVYLDPMNLLGPLPVKSIRDALPKTIIVYDGSHVLGLIAGKQFQQPFAEGADIIQGNTHKTFPGPHKALIAFARHDLADRVRTSLSYGLISTQHSEHTAALIATIFEMDVYAEEYAEQVVANARHLAESLRQHGIQVTAQNATFTHMVYIPAGRYGDIKALVGKFSRAGISMNGLIAFRGKPYIRLGVQEVTRAGMGEPEMSLLGELIARLLSNRSSPQQIAPVTHELSSQFPGTRFSFDEDLGFDLKKILNTHAGKWNRAEEISPPEEPAPADGIEIRQKNGAKSNADPGLAEKFCKVIRDLAKASAQYASAGNASILADGWAAISRRGANLSTLGPEDLCLLKWGRSKIVENHSAHEPSSETLMHLLIYESVPEARAVIHLHIFPTPEAAGKYDIAIVPPSPSGDPDNARSVSQSARKSRIIHIRQHGLVIWARSLKELNRVTSDIVTLSKVT